MVSEMGETEKIICNWCFLKKRISSTCYGLVGMVPMGPVPRKCMSNFLVLVCLKFLIIHYCALWTKQYLARIIFMAIHRITAPVKVEGTSDQALQSLD